jgi:hypothetical protein
VPRATIQAWLQGTRFPSRDRLDHLVRAVGATQQERAALARTLARLSAGQPGQHTLSAGQPGQHTLSASQPGRHALIPSRSTPSAAG